MKKIVLTGAALLLSASILGACGKEDTASKTSAEVKQESPAQTNVKELPITSQEDKDLHTGVEMTVDTVKDMDEDRRAESLKSVKESNLGEDTVGDVITVPLKYVFKGDTEQPVSDYKLFLYTYTGKDSSAFTEETKKEAQNITKEIQPLVDTFKKDTGVTDVSKVTVTEDSSSTKVKDKGNNQYEITGKVTLNDGTHEKTYDVTTNAVYNTMTAYIQAKDFKFNTK